VRARVVDVWHRRYAAEVTRAPTSSVSNGTFGHSTVLLNAMRTATLSTLFLSACLGLTAAGALATQTDLPNFASTTEVPDASLSKYHVALTCAVENADVGTMTIAVWGDLAPITVRNFLRLCSEGFYDGKSFHRILRDFMVQGGDPTGTGAGNSPHGTIKAEFSTDPARAHGYGVLSMARMGNDPNSASCQFFICCDESPAVWNLDGQYASFGRVTSGVATLEALANTPVLGARGEASKPKVAVTIKQAKVISGPAPAGEVIVRPQEVADLGGQPERITVQHVLISFQGTPVKGVTRTKEEAEALAQEVLAKVQAGEDFEALVRAHSDDPPSEKDPGMYRILNTGVRDSASERRLFDLEKRFRKSIEELDAERAKAPLNEEQYQTRFKALQSAAQAEYASFIQHKRSGLVPAFGDVGFTLEVGAVGLAPFDTKKSPFGWHVIKRLQ
jgi:peptidyl-prolyl cis-trans isomerase B (cyclophilin B)